MHYENVECSLSHRALINYAKNKEQKRVLWGIIGDNIKLNDNEKWKKKLGEWKINRCEILHMLLAFLLYCFYVQFV